MNYLEQIPKDLFYIICDYLSPDDISNLGTGLEIYINYKKLLLNKYPKTYRDIIDLIKSDLSHNFKLLHLINYNDNIKEVLDRYVEYSSSITDILSHIYLMNQYPNLIKYFDEFPNYSIKYLIIYRAMGHLRVYKDNLKNLFGYVHGTLPSIDPDELYEEVYNIEVFPTEIVFIYLIYLMNVELYHDQFKARIIDENDEEYRTTDVGYFLKHNSHILYAFILISDLTGLT